MADDLADVAADRFAGDGLCGIGGRVPDDVAVCKVCDDEIIALVDAVAQGLRHVRQSQLRHGLERHAFRRRDPDVVFAVERDLIAAVEEERHVRKLLALRKVHLRLSVCGEHLGERLLHLARRKRDRQIGIALAVHGEDDEIQRIEHRALEALEVRIGERVGELGFALASAAAEDHAVAGFHKTHRAVAVIQVHRLETVFRAAVVCVDPFHGARQRVSAGKLVLCHCLLLSDAYLMRGAGSSAVSGQNLPSPGKTFRSSSK